MEDGDEDTDEPTTTGIVLAEDKKYYPSAQEVYGEDTETLVETEDAQALEVPIIASAKKKRFEIVSEDVKLDTSDAKMKCKPEYLEMLWRTPVLSRNVCIAGHLHHGKSSLVDALVEETHDVSDAWKYDDNLGSSSTLIITERTFDQFTVPLFHVRCQIRFRSTVRAQFAYFMLLVFIFLMSVQK